MIKHIFTISSLIASVLHIQMYHSPLIAFQIVLVTRYWTKFNIAAVCVSVLLFFICTRITHSAVLFRRSPSDYLFIGTLVLISSLSYSIHFCHLSDVAPGCGHFNIHYCRNCWI